MFCSTYLPPSSSITGSRIKLECDRDFRGSSNEDFMSSPQYFQTVSPIKKRYVLFVVLGYGN